MKPNLTDGPAHLKDAICGVAKPKPSGTRKVSRKVSRKGGSKKRSTVSTGASGHVRYGSLADIPTSPRHVRFTPNNGSWAAHPSQHLAAV